NITSHDVSTEFSLNTPLIDILQSHHLDFYQPCGGQATCGKCLVRFSSGAPKISYFDRLFISPEELDSGYRLACKSVLDQSAVLELPAATDIQHLVVETGRVAAAVNPLIRTKRITVKKPDLESGKSDQDLLADACEIEQISAFILKKLPDILRTSNFKITILTAGNKILDIYPGSENPTVYGIALDIGSTTLVASLHDINAGKTLAVETAINPQTRYGDDLVSRLSFIIKYGDSQQKLTDVVISKLNDMISRLCHKAEISSEHVYALVASGNVVMTHLFLGVNPRYVGYAPFTPVFKEMRVEQASTLGVKIHPEAQVYVMPNIGGYVGGDIVSDILTAGFGTGNGKTRLLIDIGTNCEVVLEHKGKMYAASAPAGPALEGSCIRYGMRAEGGAIYDSDGLNSVRTISDRPARGICGSGLVHLIDALYSENYIDLSGRISLDRAFPADVLFAAAEIDNQRAIRIIDKFHGAERDLYLVQDDIREFQLARSAIVAAWKLLCRVSGCGPQNIDEIYIAGAFGNFIRPDAAIRLGLVPAKNLNHIHFIGNASLEGGRMTLLDRDVPDHVRKMAAEISFIEMAGRLEFQDLYIENMHFPPL
ncbi:MAG: DUF4445 domain-containing protein, partial [Calditrichales bacterium]